MILRDYAAFDLSNFPVEHIVRVEDRQNGVVIITVVEGHSFLYIGDEFLAMNFVNRWKNSVFYPEMMDSQIVETFDVHG